MTWFNASRSIGWLVRLLTATVNPWRREMKIRSEALSLCVGTEAVGQLEMVTEGVLKLPSRCSRQRCFGDRSWRRDLSVGGLTADQRDRDMPHRRIRFGAMPMAFTSLDMDDVAEIDLALFLLCRHHP